VIGTLTVLIGSPGAGKSTLIEHLTRGLDCAEMQYRKTALRVLWYQPGGFMEFGRLADPANGKPRRGGDRLDRAACRFMAACLRDYQPAFAFGEGQRMMSLRLLEEVRAIGYSTEVWWLDCPEELALERLSQRDPVPSLTWVRGQRSRVANFADATRAQRLEPFDLSKLPPALEKWSPLVGKLDDARSSLTLPPHW
jgi:hypothetical protein